MKAQRVSEAQIQEPFLQFVLLGAPRTKKNHGRVIVRGDRRFHVQSEAHEKWHDEAMVRLVTLRATWLAARIPLPIAEPVHVQAMFWRDRRSGDLVGFQQALGDLLQDAGIIADDKLIESWDGTRLNTKVALTPRIEVEIRRMA